MLLTMYSILRDKYRVYSIIMDILILVASIIICATVFIDPSLVQLVGLNDQNSRLILGLFSLLVFILSLVSMITNWSGKAEKYSQSAEVLSRLKGECRDYLNLKENLSEAAKQWVLVCRTSVDTLPIKIPEKDFNKLKAKHLRKVEISKLTSTYPGCPIVFLNITLLIRSTHSLCKGGDFSFRAKSRTPLSKDN